MPSTIPAVKVALVDLFTSTLPDVEVSYGGPGAIMAPEMLLVSTIEWEDEFWPNIGNKSREERYRVHCAVSITSPEDDQQIATERVFTLFEQIESALFASPTLGIPGVIKSEPQPSKMVEPTSDSGRVAQIEFHVHVRARYS